MMEIVLMAMVEFVVWMSGGLAAIVFASWVLDCIREMGDGSW